MPTAVTKEIILIAAVGPDGLIGDGKRLPWKLPRDMRLFRRLTANHAIVMGRKTFESLDSKPLPRRRNIVVTRNPNYVAGGCSIAHSIGEAMELAGPDPRVFVIGGGDIYRQALPYATAILLSEIFDENPNQNLFETFKGDVYFPDIDREQWTEVRASRRSYIAVSSIQAVRDLKRKGLQFKVRRYVRVDSGTSRFPRLTGKEIEGHLATPKSPDQAPEVEQPDLFPQLLGSIRM